MLESLLILGNYDRFEQKSKIAPVTLECQNLFDAGQASAGWQR